ncbi:GNAT family N-acetyltransferase [Microbispora sp. RL4-1S]|uniref:GNAT family N-acetyltransferase n=1 Tax=Microbispora oryzae TaxID=2806554 RepID=A0A940WJL4_9ACTN|nr:GNAT family protein [Microbispora oryzae]MBP2704058.1 GNAT family N-acetyltransferase [Microbispora oryzae]
METVRLRPIRERDIPAIEAGASSREGLGELQWFGFRTFHRMRERVTLDGYLGPDSGGLAVDVGGEVAGWVSWSKQFWGPETTSWSWTIGVILFPAFRGRGIGTAVKKELADYLFAHTVAERIQATTDVRNVAAQRALEKAGFQREGVLRRAQWRLGEWHDQVLYAALREPRDRFG